MDERERRSYDFWVLVHDMMMGNKMTPVSMWRHINKKNTKRLTPVELLECLRKFIRRPQSGMLERLKTEENGGAQLLPPTVEEFNEVLSLTDINFDGMMAQ